MHIFIMWYIAFLQYVYNFLCFPVSFSLTHTYTHSMERTEELEVLPIVQEVQAQLLELTRTEKQLLWSVCYAGCIYNKSPSSGKSFGVVATNHLPPPIEKLIEPLFCQHKRCIDSCILPRGIWKRDHGHRHHFLVAFLPQPAI